MLRSNHSVHLLVESRVIRFSIYRTIYTVILCLIHYAHASPNVILCCLETVYTWAHQTLATVQMNPRGKVTTQAVTSHWRFEGVDVVAMSLDWFRAAPVEDTVQQPGSSSAQPKPRVEVSMSDCVLRSIKCASSPENDMAHSWLNAIAGDGGSDSTDSVRP